MTAPPLKIHGMSRVDAAAPEMSDFKVAFQLIYCNKSHSRKSSCKNFKSDNRTCYILYTRIRSTHDGLVSDRIGFLRLQRSARLK